MEHATTAFNDPTGLCVSVWFTEINREQGYRVASSIAAPSLYPFVYMCVREKQ